MTSDRELEEQFDGLSQRGKHFTRVTRDELFGL